MTTEYLKAKEAKHYLGIKSINTLKKLIDNGLPVIELAGTKYFSKSDIDKFMNDHKKVSD